MQVLAGLALVLAWPAWAWQVAAVRIDGYDIDIFRQTGPGLWACVLVELGAGVALLAMDVRQRRLVQWSMGLMVAGCTLLPLLIGYWSYGRDDNLTILGAIGGMERTGTVSDDDFYPGTKLLALAGVYATGTTTNVAFALGGAAANAAVLLALCALAMRAAPRGWALALAPPFAFYFGWFHASGIPNWVTMAAAAGAILAMWHAPTGHARSVVVVVTSFAAIVSHPFVALFILVSLGLHAAWRWRSGGPASAPSGEFLVVALALIFWAIFNQGLENAVRTAVVAFREGATSTVAAEGSGKLSTLGLGTWDLITTATVTLGRYVLPLAAIAIAGLAGRRARSGQPAWPWLLLLGGAFVQGLLLFNPVVSHNVVRLTNINYAVFGLVPLTALAVLRLRGTRTGRVCAVMLVAGTLAASVGGLYDSPLNQRPNQQFGKEDLEAMRWVVGLPDERLVYNPLGDYHYRAQSLLLAVERYDDPRHGTLGDHFAEADGVLPGSYLVTPKRDVEVYPELYPQVGRFDPRDFAGLQADGRWHSVFDSGETQIYSKTPLSPSLPSQAASNSRAVAAPMPDHS